MAGKVLQNGKYLLNALVEPGELEVTYQASHSYLNQTVLLKTLNPNLSQQINLAQVQPQFMAEAGRIAQCQHPNLARVLDCFHEEGRVFVVQEAIAGQSLADLVETTGPLPEEQAIYYIRQAGLALQVLHQHGILHRQITPQNLVRRQHSESIMLTNYGLARDSLRTTPAYTHTLPSGYAAPEQYQPQAQLAIATDLYALAATLYFLVTGQSPVAAPLRSRITMPSLRHLQPKLSPAFEQAVLQALSLDAAARPKTIDTWLSLLIAPLTAPEAPPRQGYYTTISAPTPIQLNLPNVQAAAVPVPSSGMPRPGVSTPANPAPRSSPTPPHHAMPATHRLPQRHLGKALLMTGAIAALAGVGVGLAIRFSANSPTPIFNTEQSFPPRSDWPGSVPADDTTTAPEPAPSSNSRSYSSPSYSAPAPAPAAAPAPKPPSNPTPSPTPVANPSPAPAAPVPAVVSPQPSPVAAPDPVSPPAAVDPTPPAPAVTAPPPAPAPAPNSVAPPPTTPTTP